MPKKTTYPIKQKYIKGYDGTKIGYQVVGSGKLPFVLCNGLGGNSLAWSPLYNAWGHIFKFMTWDYRGLFSSETPQDLKNISIEDHIKDLELVLKKEKINKAVFCGWSMGVQVCLEFYRKHAKMYKGIFLINGTYGSPFHTALNLPIGRYLFPTLNQLVKKVMPRLQPHIKPVAKLVLDTDGFLKLIHKLGLIHENFESELLREVAHAMLDTNIAMFHEILAHLGEHDAGDILSKIDIPTLLVAGSRDILTPSKVAEKMASLIPDAELLILPQGSHYCILEFPEIINRRLFQFLMEHKLIQSQK